MNILQDNRFQNGLRILKRDHAENIAGKCLDLSLGQTPAVWKVAQWWASHDLTEGDSHADTAELRIADRHKCVTLNRHTGSITLALDASADFPHSSAAAPEKWPHLLLEQSIPAETCPLQGAGSLTATLDFSIDHAKDLRDQKGLHAQFAWFIYICDTTPSSAGYGNFLWFGLNLFCPPHTVTASHSSQDTAGGPGNFIYSLSSADIFPDIPEEGRRITFSLDILPYVEKALSAAQSKGFMQGTKTEDCSVIGTNIGWEVFDRWNVAVTIHHISIDRRTE